MADPSTPSPLDRIDKRQLTGWKEIATFFDKGVRTVQRWEGQLALPVHRVNTGRGETVYAFAAELDAWRRAVEARNLPNGWDREEAVSTATDGTVDPRSRAGGDPPSGPDDSNPNGGESGAPAHYESVGIRWRWLRLAAAFAALVATAVTAWVLTRPRGDAGASAPLAPAASKGQPSVAKIDIDTLLVYDAAGHELWSRRFGQALATEPSGGRSVREGKRPLLVVEDLDDDGSREVLMLTRYRDTEQAGGLLCLDATGRTRFEVPAPQNWVRFGDENYGPPWIGHHLFVTGDAHRRTLWAVWVHVRSGNFPCLLQRLSLSGRVESEYWSAGYVESVREAVVGGRRAVLVGAANNDHKGASLAVFDEHAVLGSSPAETDEKTCHNCPAGGPFAFLVFPRMELSGLIGSVPGITDVHRQEDGVLRVSASQLGRLGEEPLPANIFYDLGPDLQPLRAEFSADYVSAHRRLEEARRVDHAFGDSDRREVWPVLVWKGGRQFVPVTGLTAK